MKNYKYWSYAFAALAVLLSDVMCATVAYHYCNMLWGIRYGGYSAPANVAFIYAIPYTAGIAICVILALVFRKRSHRRM